MCPFNRPTSGGSFERPKRWHATLDAHVQMKFREKIKMKYGDETIKLMKVQVQIWAEGGKIPNTVELQIKP